MTVHRTHNLRVLYILAMLAAMAGLVYLNLNRKPPETLYATTPVRRGTLVDRLAETGTIELVRTVEVKSTISGKIRSLAAEVGDRVVKGQVLAAIEPDPAQALQLSRQRAEVDRAGIDLQEQESRYARKKQLRDRGLLSPEEFEEAERQRTKAQYALRLAAFELEILELQANIKGEENRKNGNTELGDVRVLAPLTGLVIRREVEIGEVVVSGTTSFTGGTTLFHIGDPSRMVVRVEISEIDAGRVRAGQAAEVVADAYPDRPCRGTVRRVAPVGERKPGSAIVTFDTEIEVRDEAPQFRQGMSCDVDIILARRPHVLWLPIESVYEVPDDAPDMAPETGRKGRRGRFIAFALKGKQGEATDAPDSSASKAPLDAFEKRTLKIGLTTSTRVEVLAGLREGDRVASDPKPIYDRLANLTEAPKGSTGEKSSRRSPPPGRST